MRFVCLFLALTLCLGFVLPGFATIEADIPLPTRSPLVTPPAGENKPSPGLGMTESSPAEGMFVAGAIPLRTPQDLLAIQPDNGLLYVLENHIDMQGVDWVPLPFGGTLLGQGFAIYNLTINKTGVERRDSYDGNRVKYDTVYAGLFSTMENAQVENLALLGLVIQVTTSENCFIGGLAGYTHKAQLDNILVSGRLFLSMDSRMGGVGGIVGFGDGTISASEARVELTFLDTQRYRKCEQFLGGITACGYTDLENCKVTMKAFASVHGYAHNGGLMGMYHVHDNKIRKLHGGYVNHNTVDAHIRFFENNKDRRAYCRRFVGEPLHRTLVMDGNEYTYFKRDEVMNYRVNLLPEMDENPVYEVVVTAPSETEFGYTTTTCTTCGYQYTDTYTKPLGDSIP